MQSAANGNLHLPMPSFPPDQLTENRTFKAVYEDYDPVRQRPRYAVGPDAFKAIMEGYGCGNCLQYFGMYLAVCPTCGEATGPAQATEPWWTDHPELVK